MLRVNMLNILEIEQEHERLENWDWTAGGVLQQVQIFRYQSNFLDFIRILS